MSIKILGKDNIYSNLLNKAYPQNNSAQSDFTEKENSIRKTEYAQRLQEKNLNSVVNQAISYADQLKASRNKSKEASLEKKKLNYNFKKISSQIIRSKNSMSARKAVQAAKREIQRLKRLKGNGDYDEEELQLAIDHAKAMEKVAKKKVSHLEQEEMVERHKNGFGAALEEIEEKNKEESQNEDEENPEDIENQEGALDVDDEYLPDYGAYYGSQINQELQAALEEAQYEMQLQMRELSESLSQNTEQLSEESSEAMSDLMDELSDEVSEMLEDLDLTELSESLYAPDPNMSEDDFKMLKIKHRGKELKEIAEADKEYLKCLMEHEKEKTSGTSGSVGASGTSSSNIIKEGTSKITPVISMPGAATEAIQAPTLSGGFSVSV